MSIEMTWFVVHLEENESGECHREYEELGKPLLEAVAGNLKCHRFAVHVYWNTPGAIKRRIAPNGTTWTDSTIIKAGNMTNGNSLPKNPFVENWDGKDMPPCIHDHLYDVGVTTRKMADQLYYAAHKRAESGWWRRYIYYIGVRIGGWKAWNDCRRAD